MVDAVIFAEPLFAKELPALDVLVLTDMVGVP